MLDAKYHYLYMWSRISTLKSLLSTNTSVSGLSPHSILELPGTLLSKLIWQLFRKIEPSVHWKKIINWHCLRYHTQVNHFLPEFTLLVPCIRSASLDFSLQWCVTWTPRFKMLNSLVCTMFHKQSIPFPLKESF